MSHAVLAAASIVFVLAFERLRIVAVVSDFLARTRWVARVVGSPRVSDARKERAVRRAALRLSAAAFGILWRSAAVVAAALACVGAAVAAGLCTADEAAEAGADPYFLAFLIALAVLQAKFVHRARAAR